MAQNSNQTKHSFYNDPDIKLVDAEDWDYAKPISGRLKRIVEQVVADKYQGIAVDLENPKDDKHGDFAVSIALQLAKQENKSPRKIAEDLVQALQADQELKKLLEKIEIAGAGFINFFLKPELLANELVNVLNEQGKYGKNKLLSDKRIMFEYAHPNPFKAFHIGHLRNIILGESLIRLLEANGAEVIRVNYQGDVGMHIAKCLWALLKVDPKSYPKDTTTRVQLIADCYVKGASAYEENEHSKKEITEVNKKIYSKVDPKINNLWELGKQWSLDKFHEIYQRVYSTFVREYMESETLGLYKQPLDEALKKGILEKSKGAVVFKGEKYGLDTRVFLNSEGLPTYEGKELGLAKMQFSDYGEIDLNIHNVAVEQISFFKVTFKVEALLDPENYAGRQYHNAYEFVGLKKGKMSSRKGNVVLGEDILSEAAANIKKVLQSRENISAKEMAELAETIGVAAVKYSFLNISPFSYLAFDLQSSLNFEGNSGPYLQYTFARANRIVKDAGKYQMLPAEKLAQLLNNDQEISVLRQVYKFPEVVLEATKHLSPNVICTYLFELAQRFNLFYKHNPILKETQQDLRSGRIMLTQAVACIMQNGLNLLGIKTVEKM